MRTPQACTVSVCRWRQCVVVIGLESNVLCVTNDSKKRKSRRCRRSRGEEKKKEENEQENEEKEEEEEKEGKRN